MDKIKSVSLSRMSLMKIQKIYLFIIIAISAVRCEGHSFGDRQVAFFMTKSIVPYSKKIPLTKGKFATVSYYWYDFLMQWKWCVSKSPHTWYAKRTLKEKKNLYMHRVILFIGRGREVFADHKDHDGLNNTEGNLRIATPLQNQYNKSAKNTYLGISYEKDRGKWGARIRIKGKNLRLGRFDSPEEAALARNKAATEFHGEFSNLNLIPNG